MRLVGQSAYEDPANSHTVLVGGRVVIVLASDHIGVHPRATDVLADFVDDQQVNRVERQAWHPLLGLDQELFFAFEEVGRTDCFDQGCFVKGVLDDRQSRDDAALLQHALPDGHHDLDPTVVLDGAMIDFGPLVFAQTDQHHLVQARFDFADEPRVWFDSATDDDVVGLGGVFVEMDGDSLRCFIDDHRVH